METLKETFKEKVLPAFREIRGVKVVNRAIFTDIITVCRGLDNITVSILLYPCPY